MPRPCPGQLAAHQTQWQSTSERLDALVRELEGALREGGQGREGDSPVTSRTRENGHRPVAPWPEALRVMPAKSRSMPKSGEHV